MTNLKNVNIMSDAKYSAATKNSDELYFTPADSYVDSRITSLVNSNCLTPPNYKALVTLSNHVDYTCPKNGFILMYDMHPGNGLREDVYVYINGVNVRLTNRQIDYTFNTSSYPVAKNDIVRIQGVEGARFAPCK